MELSATLGGMITQDIAVTIPRETLKCKKCGRRAIELKTDGGRKDWCVDCIRAYYAEYRTNHRKDCNRRMREWRETNKEKARKYSREYGVKAYRANPEHHRAKAIAYRRNLKDTVYAAYGGYRCSCCGETTPSFLTIDHKNNNGAEHRRSIGRCGNNLLLWIKKNNFPSEFQILCWNCQWGKKLAGTCPHQSTRND